jgi:hypothetical protein
MSANQKWRSGELTLIEGETHYQLSLGAARASYHGDAVAAKDARAVVCDVQRIPSELEPTMSTSLDHSTPISRWNLDAYFNLAYVYRDTQIDAATALESDEAKEIALRLGVGRDRWTFTIFGDNLADERYAFVRTSSGAQANHPRRIGARFAYSL